MEDGVGLFGDGGVVSDYNDGAAVIVSEGAKYLDYVGGVGGVKVARGLIGEDDLASLCEGARDRNSLLLAAREVCGKAIVVVCGKLDPFADLCAISISVSLFF